MKNKISILGCGWLGKALAIQLIDNGYEVKGSSTSNNKLDEFHSIGITPFIIDINKHNTDLSDFLASDVLVIAITSKNIDSFKKLIEKIEKSTLRKIIFISSTSVYPYTNGIVTEKNDTIDSPLAHIEQLFISNPLLESTVVRFGGLFGYNRQPGNFIKAGKKIKNPEGYINFIHRNDCIQIIEQIIIKNTWNQVLNACADSHPSRRDFYSKETKKLGKTAAFDEGSNNEYKIINSQKLKDLLNFEFEYANLME